jgi:uncharacterized membrane protein YhaH (DUF805 family)
MNYFLAALKKYAVFKGRAQRAEYWYFVLISAIIGLILMSIDAGGTFPAEFTASRLTTIGSLFFLLPSISVGVRRLHDIGYSGWWYLVWSLVPVFGQIILFFLLITDSSPGSNKYGPNPKGVSAPTK